MLEIKWSGSEDLNLRPPGPKPDSGSSGTLLNCVGRNSLMWNDFTTAPAELLSLIERECFDRRKIVYSCGYWSRSHEPVPVKKFSAGFRLPGSDLLRDSPPPFLRPIRTCSESGEPVRSLSFRGRQGLSTFNHLGRRNVVRNLRLYPLHAVSPIRRAFWSALLGAA